MYDKLFLSFKIEKKNRIIVTGLLKIRYAISYVKADKQCHDNLKERQDSKQQINIVKI